MTLPTVESVTKRNKTPPPTFYGFHSFAEGGYPVSLTGAFRDNVRRFLQQCAGPLDYDLDGMPVWCTFLVYENRGTVLPLYTVEENVNHSDRPFCDYCRCAGWSRNLVSKRKYHLIIPANEEWNNPLEEGAFDVQTHLLHGLVHCNGFGHLICINGIEGGGSDFVGGREIMDLWDRICTALHARQVTVDDSSRKHSMDLQLLYGVAYGHSWFGKWGYRFCRGSFGVKEHNYESAIDLLSSLELDQIIHDFSSTNACMHIKEMIHHYRDMSDTNLVTIRDLLRFMLTLKSTSPTTPRYPKVKTISFSAPVKRCSLKFSSRTLRNCSSAKAKPAKCRKFSNLAANLDSRWPVRRLEQVAEVIVEALKEKIAANGFGGTNSCGMTRQEARDAARLHVGDTGLIDHVLKVMNNVIVGNYVVERTVNRSTKVLEYTIRDLNQICNNYPEPSDYALNPAERRDCDDDVAYLYKNVLVGYPDSDDIESVRLAVEVVLHSKHFVKEWTFRDEDDDSLRFICGITIDEDSNCDDVSSSPREVVVVPLFATIGDLKIAVQNAMRDTYCVMENLYVTDILEMEGVGNEEVLFGVMESGREIWVRGLDWSWKTDA